MKYLSFVRCHENKLPPGSLDLKYATGFCFYWKSWAKLLVPPAAFLVLKILKTIHLRFT